METALGLICAGFFILGATGFAVFAIVGSKLNQQAKDAKAKRQRDLAAIQASYLTEDRLRQVHLGMMLADVVAIAGEPRKEVAAVAFEAIDAPTHTVIYSWPTGPLSAAVMTFVDGRLTAKSQAGL
jgi:uncharacterized iron-regulated membrane protein